MAAHPRQSVAPGRTPDTREAAFRPLIVPLADVERSVGERFAAQVRHYGGRVALHTPTGTRTYLDLAAAARAIAARLMDRLGPDEHPVLLLLKDDARFISAFLGGLQAGKICVPVDPDHPIQRLTAIWRDTGARLLVTETTYLDLARQIAGDPRDVLNVADRNDDSGGAAAPLDISPDRPACIIYTSGSSGAPKGVIHTHRSLLHSVLKATNTWTYSAEDRWGLLTARGTGAEMIGIFGTLLIGAELHPFHLQQTGLSRLISLLRERGITIWRMAPSLYRHCVEILRPGDVFPSVRLVRLGSEPATLRDLELFRRHFPPGCVLCNAYAATETGLIRTAFFDHDTAVAGHLLPVGYPVPDTEVLVTDPAGEPMPPGEVGEIVVRGEYLTAGYWNRPDLTAAAFLPDPVGGNRRMYRTGDLGRMAEDGCLMHLGRCDQQVRIRGYRVELAEVEAALLQAPAVKAAAAAAHEDGHGGNRLVGYVVPAPGTRPVASRLRAFLKGQLPDHMVPGAYVVLDELPTTGAGKLDRGALPAPAAEHEGEPPAAEPRTHLEVQLAGIWAEMLHRRIGLQEDFFDLGGDSLLATQMLYQVEQDCGGRVDSGRVLDGLTIERLATELLDSSREMLATPVVQVQSGASRTPFFFLHSDFDSGGFYCRRLARALGPDVTMYAVQPHGMNGTTLPDSIEEMAAERLQSILEIQPSGPYSLGGFCGGGVIAYELARQLVARGEQVTTVLIIDGRAPNLAYRFCWTLARRVAAVLRLSPRIERALFLRLKWYREEIERSGRTGVAGWTGFLRGKLRALGRRCIRGGGDADPAGQSGAAVGPRSLWNEYHQRMSFYVPGPLAGKISLFRSSYLEGKRVRDTAAGWDSLASHVEVHPVPGDHHTCVTTHAAELAARMRPYLPG